MEPPSSSYCVPDESGYWTLSKEIMWGWVFSKFSILLQENCLQVGYCRFFRQEEIKPLRQDISVCFSGTSMESTHSLCPLANSRGCKFNLH